MEAAEADAFKVAFCIKVPFVSKCPCSINRLIFCHLNSLYGCAAFCECPAEEFITVSFGSRSAESICTLCVSICCGKICYCIGCTCRICNSIRGNLTGNCNCKCCLDSFIVCTRCRYIYCSVIYCRKNTVFINRCNVLVINRPEYAVCGVFSRSYLNTELKRALVLCDSISSCNGNGIGNVDVACRNCCRNCCFKLCKYTLTYFVHTEVTGVRTEVAGGVGVIEVWILIKRFPLAICHICTVSNTEAVFHSL